jgi:O-antigen/teichoic acid export membrane protein
MAYGIFKLFQRRRYQTVADQFIVSGSNFATGIILVRGLGLEQFGVFTVAYALLLLANSIQLSFIASPMITWAGLFPEEDERTSYLRGMYGVQLWFCVFASIAIALVAIIFLAAHRGFGTFEELPAFLFCVVAYLMQDWLRRYYFAKNQSLHSVWNDAISYLGQTVILLRLMHTHELTVRSAFWTIATTSALAFAVGAAMERLGCSAKERRSAWQRSRGMSRDLAIANQLQWFVYQGAMLIGASVLGSEAAGSIRATQNVVGPVNVAYQAMENIVPLKASEEMRKGGVAGAARFLLRFGIKGFVVLTFAFLAIGLFSKDFLRFFYGRKVAVYSGILDLQLLYFLLYWPLRQYSYLFRATGETSAIFRSSLAAAASSLVLVWPCIHFFHAMGIMIAAVCGQFANLLWFVYEWHRTKARKLSMVEMEIV